MSINIFKEMLDMQNKAHRAATQLPMEDIKSEIWSIRKNLKDVNVSVAFMSKDNDSMKMEMKSVNLHIRKWSTKMEHIGASPVTTLMAWLPM